MATRGSAQEVSDWDHILAIERSLGFKSQRSQLLCHRQKVPIFDKLFTRIANLHPDYAELVELSAEQICEEALFQAQCDAIFDDLARSIWKGPEALWLVKETEHAEYGEGTSTDCFWTTSDKRRTEWSAGIKLKEIPLDQAKKLVTAGHCRRLTPGAERNSRQGATDAGVAHGTPASANTRPAESNIMSPLGASRDIPTAMEGVRAFDDRSVTAHDDFNGGENNDNNEPVVRESPQINHEDGRQDVIVISDDEDDGHQRNTSQRIPRATLGGPVPSRSTATAPRTEPQSSKTGIFEGRRARVSWGPKEPFDDILALSGCSSSNNLIQRIEAIKAKRQKIRHWQIAAAGVKFDGGACFRIPWDDAGPAFEEMEEMLQGVSGGLKFDLRFEIEWEDEDEGKPVKMELD
ncbi:hypothetical protein PRZ48_015152 [Zasmidium cellare]|uniref:Uncharacterized protein n=1 Tax=Zasmidium cellare TaxID=395010 RepID=A0ABR0DXS2_ZASCE|nr:hypothetical protein PRZ48_015152 [Zasmidium cellare]